MPCHMQEGNTLFNDERKTLYLRLYGLTFVTYDKIRCRA